MVKLAVFDMDGTLIEKKSSWATLNMAFGTSQVGLRGLELYNKGVIKYPEFMMRDIAAWPETTTRAQIEQILLDYRLRSDAKETLRRLEEDGFEIAMLSGGIDILAQKVASELGIEEWIANGLKFDEDGRLLKEGICRVEPSKKHLIMRRMMREKKAKKEDVIAVGDGRYDVSMLREARIGFLLALEGEVVKPPIIRITSLSEILGHV